jgi:hypothetical protein
LITAGSLTVFTCQRSVHGDEKTVILSGSRNDSGLVEDEGAEAGRRGSESRVHDRPRDGDAVSRI